MPMASMKTLSFLSLQDFLHDFLQACAVDKIDPTPSHKMFCSDCTESTLFRGVHVDQAATPKKGTKAHRG